MQLGLTYFKLGNQEKTEESLTKAINSYRFEEGAGSFEMESLQIPYYMYRAAFYKVTDQKEKSLQDLDKIKEIEKNLRGE